MTVKESGQKRRAQRISVQLRDTSTDALLGTPPAKRHIEQDNVFVKQYCIKIGIEKIIVDVHLIPVMQNFARQMNKFPGLLPELNSSVLLGNTTDDPLYIVQMVLEELWRRKGSLLVWAQDMKKAFDSQSPVAKG
ncbi:hypothetical protein BJ742DRAFT_737119 [Cladochytrium replicatum]|nr:hypothetical protein BJ742DRAFT_737119 [Cladochytrium replicatum]